MQSIAAEARVILGETRACVLDSGDALLVRVHPPIAIPADADDAVDAAELLRLRANFVAAARPGEVHVLLAGVHAICQAGSDVALGKKSESESSARAVVSALNGAFDGRGGGSSTLARSRLSQAPTLDEVVHALGGRSAGSADE